VLDEPMSLETAESKASRRRPDFNLLLDFRDLSERLSRQLDSGDAADDPEAALNAFLYAAGLHQVVEDYLHREAFVLKRAERLTEFGEPLTALAGRLASATVAAATRMRRLSPRDRRIVRWADELARMLETLATAAMDPRRAEAMDDARTAWLALHRPIERFPRRLLEKVMRLPHPSYEFDQRPEDCRELVRRFSLRWPEHDRPLLVVGIRASGTYLAPLCAVLLRESGYREVSLLTGRPRQKWRKSERSELRATALSQGLILVLDDPPLRGATIARVAQDLERFGVARQAIVLMLALFGPAKSLPTALAEYDAVELPWRDWEIQKLLAPSRVEQALARLLVGRDVPVGDRTIQVTAVTDVERLDTETDGDHAASRAHVVAVFRVHLADAAGTLVEQNVEARGVGLGHFADHVSGVAKAVVGYAPHVYGVENGLLYQERLPDEWRLDPSRSSGIERRMVSYVLDRRQQLRLARDPVFRVEGYAVWRLAADIIGIALARTLRSFLYPLTHTASRRLLAVDEPSVIDGNMAPESWFARPNAGPEGALKSSWIGGAICFDMAFDLASAAAGFEVEEQLREDDDLHGLFAERLREEYRSRDVGEIDPARWFLYELAYNHQQLARLSSRLAAGDGKQRSQRGAAEEPDDLDELVERWLATERALAAANMRFFAAAFFKDVSLTADGPLCAIDIDGTLETRWYDFPAITPAGGLALRALARHGHRAVLATGRPLRELRARCRSYPLAGGVAEYGAIVYDHISATTRFRFGEVEEREMARLRDVVAGLHGVYLDPAYRHIVRAVRFDRVGNRRGLDAEQIGQVLDAAGCAESVQPFRGAYQTDFAPVSISKGAALRALAEMLGADAEAPRPYAFAIGDAWPDVPMLELADAPYVPANMGKALRDELRKTIGARATRDPHGAGVLQAVSSFLGHRPLRCRTCKPTSLSGDERLVLAALAGSDGPRRASLAQTVRLARLLLSRRGSPTAPRAKEPSRHAP
jgi:hydroxymethylpyrimidine pyrophosphatase-like HAD family hydrolase